VSVPLDPSAVVDLPAVPPPTCSPSTRPPNRLVRYLAGLSTGRYVLWCYLAYWLVVVVRYFDPSPRLWLTSVGVSGIVGVALYLSTTRAGRLPVPLGRWPTFRLFLMPFCVSSFSALVKPHEFVLVFAPRWPAVGWEVGTAAAAWAGLAVAVRLARRAAGGTR
jgi:hypothetical protein